MKPILLLLLGAGAAFCQPVSFGVKLGVPLTDFLDAVKTSNNAGSFLNYATHTNRYIFGLGGEIKLPAHLGIELDALYRHVNYSSTQQISGITTTIITTGTKANAFEFPLLLKYRFGGHLVKPYIAGGVAWDTLQGLRQDVRTSILNVTNSSTASSTSSPSQLQHKTSRGFVTGAGLDIKILLIHVKPEIRYTRWGAEHFFDSSLLHTNKNQGEFILGIQF